ncbi:hypothetical protein J6590_048426 [Homalodisca vitripennis]|nr:hypothetical protein J6590_048426 [Homalodisca vitripennis]
MHGRTTLWRAPEKILGQTPSCPATADMVPSKRRLGGLSEGPGLGNIVLKPRSENGPT